jgi:hypothetical protein
VGVVLGADEYRLGDGGIGFCERAVREQVCEIGDFHALALEQCLQAVREAERQDTPDPDSRLLRRNRELERVTGARRIQRGPGWATEPRPSRPSRSSFAEGSGPIPAGEACHQPSDEAFRRKPGRRS